MNLVPYVPLSSGFGNLYFHFTDLLGIKVIEFHTFLEQE